MPTARVVTKNRRRSEKEIKRLALLVALSIIGVLGASTASAGSAIVSTRHTAALGTFLVSSGRTLYLFEADSRNQSTSSSPCAGPGRR